MAENSDDHSLAGGKPIEPDAVEPVEEESPEEAGDQGSPRRTTAELTMVKRTLEFSGPLPPPDVLQDYNGAFAGCAERIVAMAERQSAHRQELERLVVRSNCSAQNRGQWFAFVLALVVICGGIFLLAQGKSIEGFAAIILAVGSLIGALIYGRSEQRKERADKSQSLPRVPAPSSPPTNH
ncbi:MAG: DUF2335 domain-containing protein [Deltaproteobacteria bacterium]|nr:DUF2335 domain-containing protein [Deltaproteobacteria bacterium]